MNESNTPEPRSASLLSFEEAIRRLSEIVQTLQGVANATTDQTSSIEQGETAPTGGDGA